MTALYILAVVVLVLFLLGQIRVGGQVEYSQAGLTAWIRLGAVFLQVFPWKWKKKERPPKEKKKPQTPKKTKPPTAEPPTLVQRAGGGLEYAQALLPILLKAAGCFYRKLQMDVLELELIVGAEDPMDAALLYGRAAAVLGALWYPLVGAFHVKDGRARTAVDFQTSEMTIYAKASLSLKIWQVLWLGMFFGIRTLWAALAVRRGQKIKQKQRKAA
ncbi:MAG: hypothetical protein HFF50_02100 [Lawsonibacter sp.]|nr:hypothetical protein [Lawsonibacter sp.]MCI8914431.1 hypothetical protein [Lawsonibacter sp.]